MLDFGVVNTADCTYNKLVYSVAFRLQRRRLDDGRARLTTGCRIIIWASPCSGLAGNVTTESAVPTVPL